jgi:bis(5'-nucleosyl)-tetraphosphatase (symmetrical)
VTEPILFVGDIQGCAEELRRLLKASGFKTGRHRLIPVGDTINRGPDAPGVLRALREAGAEPILGNHERHVLAVVEGREEGDWKREGSALTQLRDAKELERAAEWIASWPLYREGSDWIVVHAGLHPKRDPEDTDPGFLTEVRYCNAKGKRPKRADGKLTEPPPGFKPWYEFYRDLRTVVFGHWARLGLLVRERLRGLDTGCVYGGSLTGLWWPEDRLVYEPSQQPYRRLPEKKNGK